MRAPSGKNTGDRFASAGSPSAIRAVPATARTTTCARPSANAANAMRVPSGEKRGASSSATSDENGSARASWRSRSLATVATGAAGRSTSIAVNAIAAAPAAATTQRGRSPARCAAAPAGGVRRGSRRGRVGGRAGGCATRPGDPAGRRQSRHGRDQPVADLGNRLDELRVARVVAQRDAQVGDHPRQHLVVDDPPRPDVVEQRLPANRLAVGGGEAQQHVHHARLDADGRSRDDQFVRRRTHFDVGERERRLAAPRRRRRAGQHDLRRIKGLMSGGRTGRKNGEGNQDAGRGSAAVFAPVLHPPQRGPS